MLIFALCMALVAFVALVFYALTASTWALVGLFVAVVLGAVGFIADWVRKARASTADATASGTEAGTDSDPELDPDSDPEPGAEQV